MEGGPCIAKREPCSHPDEGRADPYRKAEWSAWYDKEGDEAEEAGISALGWIDDRSPDRVREIDGMLVQIDVDRLPVPVLLDLMSSTYCLRNELKYRAKFIEKGVIFLGTKVGPERAHLLTRSRA
jgi:hypothetical protein